MIKEELAWEIFADAIEVHSVLPDFRLGFNKFGVGKALLFLGCDFRGHLAQLDPISFLLLSRFLLCLLDNTQDLILRALILWDVVLSLILLKIFLIFLSEFSQILHDRFLSDVGIFPGVFLVQFIILKSFMII